MKFSLFFIAEYANMMTASALMATLFFGGWDIPFTQWDNVAPHTGWKTLLTFAVFAAKTLFFVFVFMWCAGRCRASATTSSWRSGGRSCSRSRSAYIVVIAATMVALDSAGIERGSGPFRRSDRAEVAGGGDPVRGADRGG